MAKVNHASSETDVLQFVRSHCRFLARHSDSVFSHINGTVFLGLNSANLHLIFPTFSDRERGLLLVHVESLHARDHSVNSEKVVSHQDVSQSFCQDCINHYDNRFLTNFIVLHRQQPRATPGDGSSSCLRCRKLLTRRDRPPAKMMELLERPDRKDTKWWDPSDHDDLYFQSVYDLNYTVDPHVKPCGEEAGFEEQTKCARIEAIGRPRTTASMADAFWCREADHCDAAGKPTKRVVSWWPDSKPQSTVPVGPAGVSSDELGRRSLGKWPCNASVDTSPLDPMSLVENATKQSPIKSCPLLSSPEQTSRADAAYTPGAPSIGPNFSGDRAEKFMQADASHVYIELADGSDVEGCWLLYVSSLCKHGKYSFEVHITNQGSVIASICGTLLMSDSIHIADAAPGTKIISGNFQNQTAQSHGRLLQVRLSTCDLRMDNGREWKVHVYAQKRKRLHILTACPIRFGLQKLTDVGDVFLVEEKVQDADTFKRLLEFGDIRDRYHLETHVGLKQLRHFENTDQWQYFHPPSRRYDDWMFPIPYPTAYSDTNFICTDAVRDRLMLDTEYLIVLQMAMHTVLLSWGLLASSQSVNRLRSPDHDGGQKFARQWSWRVRHMVLCALHMKQPRLQQTMASVCRLLQEVDMDEDGSGEAKWTLGPMDGLQWWADQGWLGGRLRDLLAECASSPSAPQLPMKPALPFDADCALSPMRPQPIVPIPRTLPLGIPGIQAAPRLHPGPCNVPLEPCIDTPLPKSLSGTPKSQDPRQNLLSISKRPLQVGPQPTFSQQERGAAQKLSARKHDVQSGLGTFLDATAEADLASPGRSIPNVEHTPIKTLSSAIIGDMRPGGMDTPRRTLPSTRYVESSTTPISA